jgi:DNA-binding response OmpR family regulator
MAKVMLVDDDATMISLLTTLLQLEGHEVAQPAPGGSVVEAALEIQPEVLLMDVYLAHENGINTLKAIRATVELKDTYVVMQSGLNVSEECMMAGANAFLLKPYPPDELLACIKAGQSAETGNEAA